MGSEMNRSTSTLLQSGSSGLKKAGKHHYSSWRWCIRRMKSQNAMAAAGALSYRTIFALIPAMVIAFLILKAFGVVENSKNSLRQLLDTAGISRIQMPSNGGELGSDDWDFPEDAAAVNGSRSSSAPASAPAPVVAASKTPPATAVTVADYIEQIMENVEKKLTFKHLGPVGLVLLVWSAITLLTTIERALNRIFEAPKSRPLLIRVLLYWSAVTIVPIIVATLGYMGAKAMTIAEQTPVIGMFAVAIDVLSSLLMGVVMLACVYKFLPNTHVSFRSALVGAGVVVPLWILAKWGFQLYLDRVVAKGSIYGTLGLLPLFLMWVNICWYAFLFGAQMAYTTANLKRLEDASVADNVFLGPMEVVGAAVAVTDGFVKGKGPTTFQQVGDTLGLPGESVRRLLDRLVEGGVICLVAGDEDADRYLPAGLPQDMPVSRLLLLGESTPPGQQQPALDENVARVIRQVKQRTLKTMESVSLADLLGSSSASSDNGK